jgi:hypothetical protein
MSPFDVVNTTQKVRFTFWGGINVTFLVERPFRILPMA